MGENADNIRPFEKNEFNNLFCLLGGYVLFANSLERQEFSRDKEL